MAEVWGAIERFLGTVLNGIYQVIPSWAVAIIVLTLLVRFVLIPITVKQIRSMTAMQRLQPELKKIQTKYKGDRQKMNEELMKLYREHGVNPLGGCAPLLMQAPAFIALYSVLRAAVLFDVAPPAAVPTQFTYDKQTVCRPGGTPSASGSDFASIVCRRGSDSQTFEIQEVRQLKLENAKPLGRLPSYASICSPHVLARSGSNPQRIDAFRCQSPFGSGHLPQNGSLFRDIVKGKSSFIGIRLGCSPQQATNKVTFRQCSSSEGSAGAAIIGYFVLVALMMGTTYYQQKQMSQQATGPQAKQMQMMTRVMPLFLGFISLNIPSGVIIYWVVSNIWTIGQQYYFLHRQQQPQAPGGPAPGGKLGPGQKGKPPAKPKPKPKR